MQFAPSRQAGHQPSAGKGIGARYPQRNFARLRRGGRNRRSESIEAMSNGRKQPLARVGQGEWSRPSPEQWLPANVLQNPDLVTDCGGCDAEFDRRIPEAQMPCGGLESAE